MGLFIAEGTLCLSLETGPTCFPVIGVTGGSRRFEGRGDPIIKGKDDWEMFRVKGDYWLLPSVDAKMGVSRTEVW